MKKEKIKRYVLFVVGLFISGVGVAITKKGELGVSPVSSIANVLSIYIPELSLGNGIIIWNCVLILGQIMILRKNFQLFQLLQVPLSIMFGYFTDFGTWMISFIDCDVYLFRFGCVIVGTVALAFGISITVTVNVIMNSGEAFVKAVSDVTKKEFGIVKILFDISCVTFSIILSLIFFSGKILGTREGTIIAAVLTGICVKFFMKRVRFLNAS